MPRSLLESLDPRPTTLSILHKTFNHDPATILADLAPAMMKPKIIHKSGMKSITSSAGEDGPNALLELPVPDSQENTSLLRGYNATAPESLTPRLRRRRLRSSLSKKQALSSVGVSKVPNLPPSELNRQSAEILVDKQNIEVRREILNKEITGVEEKIRVLEEVKEGLERELLGLREEELELEDELDGVLTNLSRPPMPSRASTSTSASVSTTSTRRRKGPAYLPAEHDALPANVAFITLNYPDPILALDFSAPYDLVLTSTSSSPTPSTSASSSNSNPFTLSLHSLKTGKHLTALRGHTAPIRALQVGERTGVSGGEDGVVRVWDLGVLAEKAEGAGAGASESGVREEGGESEDVVDEFGNMSIGGGSSKGKSKLGNGDGQQSGNAGSGTDTGCMLSLGAHSRAITSLYFDSGSLVTSALDKTIRQWDLTTGQCILTMDVLYSSLAEMDEQISGSRVGRASLGGRRGNKGRSSLAPSGAGEMGGLEGSGLGLGLGGLGGTRQGQNESYVGALQFWGYALISGSADGGIRMWDMRTGQSHRALTGHTGPINVLQFDESHVVTGSGDKTIRIWDLRTGTTSESLLAEHPITDLQFDSRKVVYCCGENGVKIYNRTTLQTTSLTMGGHTQPATKLRYMDRYLVSGGMDSTVKVWAL